MKPVVVIGILGTTLDGGARGARWERWRPTVSIFQQDEVPIARLELLHGARSQPLADIVIADVKTLAPDTVVHEHALEAKDPWDFVDMYAALHDFAKSYPWDPAREDYLVDITTGTHVAQICLFLLAEAQYLPGRLLQTGPPRADDGPSFRVIDLDLSRYDALASRFRHEHRDARSLLKDGIETKNAAFNLLIERVEQVSVASRTPILLLGPTGAGKSQLAKRIFALKKARQKLEGPLVEVNCATLRGDTAMSTLFGHVKGAFTGALADRPGLLRRADKGVLFLDEIGELGADEQAMLLRAVEEGVFYPMGSDREAHAVFQLVAGSNRDLEAMAAAGTFRADLLARLNLWTFRLPALRDRKEDIAPNLAYELERASTRMGRNVTMSREAKTRFLAFAGSAEAVWPGNFRDLDASVTRMATLGGDRIGIDVVEEEIGRLRALFSSFAPAPSTGRLEAVMGVRAASLDRFDRSQLADALEVCASSSSLSEAGRLLFASSRAAKKSANDADRLRKYLARFGLDFAEARLFR